MCLPKRLHHILDIWLEACCIDVHNDIHKMCARCPCMRRDVSFLYEYLEDTKVLSSSERRMRELRNARPRQRSRHLSKACKPKGKFSTKLLPTNIYVWCLISEGGGCGSEKPTTQIDTRRCQFAQHELTCLTHERSLFSFLRCAKNRRTGKLEKQQSSNE